MLIIIILIALILIGVGFLIGGHICNKDRTYLNRIEWPNYIGSIFVILFSVVLAVHLIGVIYIQCNKDLEYQNTLEQYEMITYKLENNPEMSGLEKESIMCSIKDYNEKIREANYYKDNLWVNIFYNNKLTELPYIEYEAMIYK